MSVQSKEPQNQPSWEARLSRTITAAPWEIGRSLSQAISPHRAAGGGYISLTIIAPSGTASSCAGVEPVSGRFALSQRYISGEYQTRTGACVPNDNGASDHLPF